MGVVRIHFQEPVGNEAQCHTRGEGGGQETASRHAELRPYANSVGPGKV